MGRHDAAMYQNLGLVLEELGRKDEAVQSWREGVQHHPQDSELAAGLSRLLTAKQQ